jgi:hypothetical protein
MKKHRPGNIKAERAYDPFPKTGLVKQYEPFIRDRVTRFCRRYPGVDRDAALFEAVKIAIEFEPKFKAKSGNDFSTPLRHHLKGLKRILVDKEKKHSARRVHARDGEVTEELAKKVMLDDAALAEHDRRAAEETEPKEALEFGSGGNAARITFQAKGVTIGFQLFGSTDPGGVIERLSPDLRVLLEPGRPRLSGRMRAVIAHSERLQREAEQEAENQKSGDWRPVFLDANDALKPSIKIREAAKVPIKLCAKAQQR